MFESVFGIAIIILIACIVAGIAFFVYGEDIALLITIAIAAVAFLMCALTFQGMELRDERNILLRSQLNLKSVEFIENYRFETEDGTLFVYDRADSVVAEIK